MAQFNPNVPCTIGAEWRPARASAGLLDSDAMALGAVLTAATTDTVSRVEYFIRTLTGGTGWMGLEIIDLTANGDLPPQPPLTVDRFYPAGDVFQAGAPFIPGTLGPHTGGLLVTGDAWESLDAVALTPMTGSNGLYYDGNEFVANFFGEGYDFAVNFAGVAGALDGRWITRIRSRALVAQYYDFDTPPGNVIRPYLWVQGRRYWGDETTIIAAEGVKEITFDWYVNPDDGLPWVPPVTDLFDSTNGDEDFGLGWVSNPTGSANNITAILAAQLEIESAGSEGRIAVGNGGDLRVGWNTIFTRDPATNDAADFPLIPGHRYLFVLRRTGGLVKLGLGRLEDRAGPTTEPDWVSADITVDPDTRRISVVGEDEDPAFALILSESNDFTIVSISEDSQPYGTLSPLDGLDRFPSLNQYYDNSIVYAGRSLRQEFTTTTGGDYAWLQILCAMVSEASDGDLSVQIRTTGGSAVGSPFTVTPEDMDDPRHSWKTVGKRITGSAITLAGATQYYFDITSTASRGKGWLVQVLNSLTDAGPPGGPPAGTAGVGIGGSANLATVDGVDQVNMDVVVSVSTLPDTVTGLAATALGEMCNIDGILVTWDDAGALDCAGFESYEVQRRDTPTGDWYTIALITDDGVTGFTDWESRRNMPADYRIRVWRADGVPSDWSTTATATATMAGPGLMFTSNALPEATVFYTDTGQQRTFEWIENVQAFEPHGRDGSIVYSENEDRLTRFTRTLRVRAGNPLCLPDCDNPAGYGTDVFTPLRSIARAALAYVCVHNEHGNRFFAHVHCPDGSWQQHGMERQGAFAAYEASIQVLEVTTTPSPIDATAGS